MSEDLNTPDMQGDPQLPEVVSFLNQYLQSSEFQDRMQELHPDQRQGALGLVFDYKIATADSADFDAFWDHVRRNSEKDLDGFARLISGSIARGLDIDLDDPASHELIFQKFMENYVDNGYFYHSFNGCFRHAIEEEGISAESRAWDTEEIKKLGKIGDGIGFGLLTGWHDINSEGTTFYASSSRNIHRYAVASPEWFAQFTSEGMHIPNGPEKTAFYRRDYQQAKQNLIEFCHKVSSRDEILIAQGREHRNLTPGEQEYIMAFFEKYWQLLAGPDSKPCVALIDRKRFANSDFMQGMTYGEMAELVGRMGQDPGVVEVITQVLYGDEMGNDLRTKETVEKSDFSIVELPEYNSLMGGK